MRLTSKPCYDNILKQCLIDARHTVVSNSYFPEKTIQTAIVDVEIKVSKVRGRGFAEAT
ncbi:MAG: hypothetical protein ACTS73_03725 [Arsenophonus sp. NEOnobi-MAG3]